jgi:hypothetical protein
MLKLRCLLAIATLRSFQKEEASSPWPPFLIQSSGRIE